MKPGAFLHGAGLCLALLAASAMVGESRAGESWDELRPALYEDREILPGEGVVTLSAPYRAADDREVPVEFGARFNDGRMIKALTFIIDENPMPVSMDFTLERPMPEFFAGGHMRLNMGSMVRAIAEADDGTLYMSETLVKTSGQGACAAPPVGDPELALANMGEMDLRVTPVSGSPLRRARLEMQHPNHTGMQMDQISLLFILPRYITEMTVWTDEEKLFTMRASITLSEDPEIEFGFLAAGAEKLRLRLTDSDDTVFERRFALQGS